jgi:hypothetical protein
MSAMPDRVKLTFEERLVLRSLGMGSMSDHDRISERVLINSGLAERCGIGEMQITPAGRALLAASGKGD